MKKGSIIAVVVTGMLLFTSLVQASEFRRTATKVSGMQCGSCLRVIDAELRKVPGVSGMTARFRDEIVIVDHVVEVTGEEISKVISGLGYPATVISSKAISADAVRRFKRAGFGSGPGCCNPGGSSPVAESWREFRRRIFKGRKRGRQGKGPGPDNRQE